MLILVQNLLIKAVFRLDGSRVGDFEDSLRDDWRPLGDLGRHWRLVLERWVRVLELLIGVQRELAFDVRAQRSNGVVALGRARRVARWILQTERLRSLDAGAVARCVRIGCGERVETAGHHVRRWQARSRLARRGRKAAELVVAAAFSVELTQVRVW